MYGSPGQQLPKLSQAFRSRRCGTDLDIPQVGSGLAKHRSKVLDGDVTCGGDEEQRCRAAFADDLQRLVDVRGDEDRGVGEQVGEHVAEGEAVVQRKRNDHSVVFGQFEEIARELCRCQPTLVGVHHPFRGSRRAAGVRDRCDVVRSSPRG